MIVVTIKILKELFDIYQIICTVVLSLLIILWIIGKRQLKKIDKKIFQNNNEDKTIN